LDSDQPVPWDKALPGFSPYANESLPADHPKARIRQGKRAHAYRAHTPNNGGLFSDPIDNRLVYFLSLAFQPEVTINVSIDFFSRRSCSSVLCAISAMPVLLSRHSLAPAQTSFKFVGRSVTAVQFVRKGKHLRRTNDVERVHRRQPQNNHSFLRPADKQIVCFRRFAHSYLPRIQCLNVGTNRPQIVNYVIRKYLD